MIPLDRVRAMLATATPSPIDVHRCDADGGDIDYQLQRGAGHGGTVLGYASDRDGSPRAKADATLWSHAPDLARDVLTLAAALETAERERDAARAEAAGLRVIVDAVDELAFCDYAAEVESYSETAPGSHAAAQARAADAYGALVRMRDAWRETHGAIATPPTVAAESATVAPKGKR